MRYKKSEVDDAIQSLSVCLEKVKHSGLCIVWLTSLLLFRFHVSLNNDCIVSLGACKDTVPCMYESFVTALCMFRNSYVHTGANSAKELLFALANYEDVSEELFELAGVPENARAVYHRTMVNIKAGESVENI